MYILCMDFKFGILNLKIFMIIMISCKHYGIPNVCTLWMYLLLVNIGREMVLYKPKLVAKRLIYSCFVKTE